MRYKLTRNIGLKFLALVVAFLIWLLVVNIDDPTRTVLFRDVKITIENEDSVTDIDKVFDIVDDDVYSDTVTIRVTERSSVLRTLHSSDFNVVADMEIMNEMGAVPLRVECTNAAVTQDEMTLIPGAMKVQLEQKKQVEFNVSVVTTGHPADEDYEVGLTEIVQGKTVQIAGAESLINKIGQVVLSVDVGGISSDKRLTGYLNVYDKNGDAFTTRMERIEIKDSSGYLLTNNEMLVDVTLWPILRDIPVQVEVEGTPAEGYQMAGVSLLPTTVNLVGTNEALAAIDGKLTVNTPISVEGATEDVTETIDLTETLAEQEELRLVQNADPTVVATVQIEKSGDQTVRLPLSNLEVLNRPDAEKISLTFSPADELQISVHADDETSVLTTEDIRASIDLSQCEEEGTYEIPVEIELPEGFSLGSEVNLVVTATAQQTAEDSTEEAEG